jgi:dTDP-4-amino-4,6-dideoxygalactose transaminase
MPWPSYTKEEAEAVQKVLLSNKVNYWTGTECREFESEFAAWCGCEYAIALANGTVALDLALKALGVGLGDDVIVPPRSYIATVSSVVNSGAKPVFADVDVTSGNINAETISRAMTPNTKAIIVVHLGGWPCDMDSIMELAEIHGLKVIEDCSQAHGAIYKGRNVGSIGHIGTWSFCQDKILTTGGEGGMVTTNDPLYWSFMWSYKDHGKSWDAIYKRDHPPGFRWVHETFGTNWRMTEIQGAIGRIQLRRLPKWTEAREKNAERIRGALLPYSGSKGVIRVPACDQENSRHAYYKFYAYVCPENLSENWDRDRIVAEINANNVPCYSGACSEIYLEKAFDRTTFAPDKRLPHARDLGVTSLMFLVHPSLSVADINLTCEVVSAVLERSGQ